MLEEVSHVGRGDHAAGRTRLQISDRGDLLAVSHAAVPLHDEERALQTTLSKFALKTFEIAFDRRAEIAVDDRRIGAGVLAGNLGKGTAEGPVDFLRGVGLQRERADLFLMLRVGPGMEQTDRNRVDPVLFNQTSDRCHHIFPV